MTTATIADQFPAFYQNCTCPDADCAVHRAQPTTQQPTPRPWRITTHCGRAAVAVSDYPQIIADCGRQNEADANAALIVRAVNAHDGLVAALRTLVKWQEDGGHSDAIVTRQAREALKLAEAE